MHLWLYWTIRCFRTFSNWKALLLSARIHLYAENECSTSTEVIGAYLKNNRLHVRSSAIERKSIDSPPSIILHICFKLFKPLFFINTWSSFFDTAIPYGPCKLHNFDSISSISFSESVNGTYCVYSFYIGTVNTSKLDLIKAKLHCKFGCDIHSFAFWILTASFPSNKCIMRTIVSKRSQ